MKKRMTILHERPKLSDGIYCIVRGPHSVMYVNEDQIDAAKRIHPALKEDPGFEFYTKYIWRNSYYYDYMPEYSYTTFIHWNNCRYWFQTWQFADKFRKLIGSNLGPYNISSELDYHEAAKNQSSS